MLNEATARNLERKAHWADHVQLIDGKPLFSWLDISPIDRCNRACVFCPRSDPVEVPNQNVWMTQGLAGKIAAELHELRYEGAVVFCGTGEPLLHPHFVDLIRPFRGLHTELVTNGDPLTRQKAIDLYAAGLGFIAVSMYDGPHQVEQFRAVFADIDSDMYILRDRWHGAEQDFGLKLTNRAGMTDVGDQPPVDTSAPCNYLQYCMTLDFDGRVLLCPQDFHRRAVFGNVASQSLMEVWRSGAMSKRRRQLLSGRDGLNPCQSCNVDGCLHGAAHAEAWAS